MSDVDGDRDDVNGVKPLDPMVIGGVIVLLVGVAALAAVEPARRASKVDPASVLRG